MHLSAVVSILQPRDKTQDSDPIYVYTCIRRIVPKNHARLLSIARTPITLRYLIAFQSTTRSLTPRASSNSSSLFGTSGLVFLSRLYCCCCGNNDYYLTIIRSRNGCTDGRPPLRLFVLSDSARGSWGLRWGARSDTTDRGTDPRTTAGRWDRHEPLCRWLLLSRRNWLALPPKLTVPREGARGRATERIATGLRALLGSVVLVLFALRPTLSQCIRPFLARACRSY